MSKRTAGWILIVVGLVMMFRMVRISDIRFFSFGGVSTSAIILVLLILSGIGVVVNNNKFTRGAVIASVALLVLSLILGTDIYFAYTSLLNVLLVFVPIIIGVGLVIKSAVEKRSRA